MPGRFGPLMTRLSAPHWADACLRLSVPYEVAPSGLRAVVPGMQVAGPVAPVQHGGSVDVFLECCENADAGAVMVIDNGGRVDEACIGDLTVLEAQDAGLAGMLVWGLHRDSAEVVAIGWPVFSYGAVPSGPRRLDDIPADGLHRARFGTFDVTESDFVVADDDGAIFFPLEKAEEVRAAAREIAEREHTQAERVRGGESLRSQLAFSQYLERRRKDASFTFRQHLRERGGAIEE